MLLGFKFYDFSGFSPSVKIHMWVEELFVEDTGPHKFLALKPTVYDDDDDDNDDQQTLTFYKESEVKPCLWAM